MTDTTERANVEGERLTDCARCHNVGWRWNGAKLVVCECGRARIPGGWQRHA